MPYVSDPAVTRHLAAFLQHAGRTPDAILFNGGFFIPDICRDRVADVMERWYGKRPLVFENRDLDLAVSVGAAYYSYVRSTGAGLLVRGGLPRAYFIGIGGSGRRRMRTVCLVPRGTRRRLNARNRSRRAAAGREQARVVPAVQLAAANRGSTRRCGRVRPRTIRDLHLHAPLERRDPVRQDAEERLCR